MTASSPTAPRPRMLVVLAFVGLFYGGVGTLTSLSTIVAFTGTQDAFIGSLRDTMNSLLSPDPHNDKNKPKPGDADVDTIATRKAQALWSRRNVLVPLSACSLIAALLVLSGSLRTIARGQGRRWGRSAWQLGALVGLPSVVLGALVTRAHTQDLIAAIADLHGPIVDELRANSGAAPLVVQAVASALYLVGVAAYLESPTVRRWTDEG